MWNLKNNNNIILCRILRRVDEYVFVNWVFMKKGNLFYLNYR